MIVAHGFLWLLCIALQLQTVEPGTLRKGAREKIDIYPLCPFPTCTLRPPAHQALTCAVLMLLWSPNVQTLTEAGRGSLDGDKAFIRDSIFIFLLLLLLLLNIYIYMCVCVCAALMGWISTKIALSLP